MQTRQGFQNSKIKKLDKYVNHGTIKDDMLELSIKSLRPITDHIKVSPHRSFNYNVSLQYRPCLMGRHGWENANLQLYKVEMLQICNTAICNLERR